MDYHFVIEAISGGFWDAGLREFRGYLFATQFSYDPSYSEELKDAAKVEPCKITKIYEKI